MFGARRLDRLEALATELGLPKEATFKVDVTDREQVKALVEGTLFVPEDDYVADAPMYYVAFASSTHVTAPRSG